LRLGLGSRRRIHKDVIKRAGDSLYKSGFMGRPCGGTSGGKLCVASGHDIH
jgi:hypothetical protein